MSNFSDGDDEIIISDVRQLSPPVVEARPGSSTRLEHRRSESMRVRRRRLNRLAAQRNRDSLANIQQNGQHQPQQNEFSGHQGSVPSGHGVVDAGDDGSDNEVQIVSLTTRPPLGSLDRLVEDYGSDDDDDYIDNGVVPEEEDLEYDESEDELRNVILDIIQDPYMLHRIVISQDPQRNNDNDEVQLVDTRPARRDSGGEVSIERVNQVYPPQVRLILGSRQEHLGSNFWSNFAARNAMGFSGAMHAHEAHIREALRRSLEENIATQTIEVKEIKHKPVPEKTRPGYTRSLDEKSSNPVCTRCEVGLGEGLQDPNSSAVGAALSKRIYFLPCGHVYCGKCVADYRSRRLSEREKSCLGDGCSQLVKKRGSSMFLELYS